MNRYVRIFLSIVIPSIIMLSIITLSLSSCLSVNNSQKNTQVNKIVVENIDNTDPSDDSALTPKLAIDNSFINNKRNNLNEIISSDYDDLIKTVNSNKNTSIKKAHLEQFTDQVVKQIDSSSDVEFKTAMSAKRKDFGVIKEFVPEKNIESIKKPEANLKNLLIINGIEPIIKKELNSITQEVDGYLVQNTIKINDFTRTVVKEDNLESLTVDEKGEISIVLDNSGWIVRGVEPQLLTLLERIVKTATTVFRFRADKPGHTQVRLLHYDIESDTITRKSYSIFVKPIQHSEIVSESFSTSSSEKNSSGNLSNISSGSEKKNDIKNEKKNNTPKKENKGDHRLKFADSLFDQKRYREAELRYSEIIKDGGANPEVSYKMGVINDYKKNLNESVKFYREALVEKNSIYYYESLINLVTSLKELKKFSEAIEALYEYGFSQSLSSSIAERLYLQLADVYFNMGEYKSASDEYRRFIATFTDSISIDKALFYLAYSLEKIEKNPEIREAIRVYQKIIKDYPESDYRRHANNRLLYLNRHFINLN